MLLGGQSLGSCVDKSRLYFKIRSEISERKKDEVRFKIDKIEKQMKKNPNESTFSSLLRAINFSSLKQNSFCPSCGNEFTILLKYQKCHVCELFFCSKCIQRLEEGDLTDVIIPGEVLFLCLRCFLVATRDEKQRKFLNKLKLNFQKYDEFIHMYKQLRDLQVQIMELCDMYEQLALILNDMHDHNEKKNLYEKKTNEKRENTNTGSGGRSGNNNNNNNNNNSNRNISSDENNSTLKMKEVNNTEISQGPLYESIHATGIQLHELFRAFELQLKSFTSIDIGGSPTDQKLRENIQFVFTDFLRISQTKFKKYRKELFSIAVDSINILYVRVYRLCLESRCFLVFWNQFGELYTELLEIIAADLMNAVLESGRKWDQHKQHLDGFLNCWEDYFNPLLESVETANEEHLFLTLIRKNLNSLKYACDRMNSEIGGMQSSAEKSVIAIQKFIQILEDVYYREAIIMALKTEENGSLLNTEFVSS